MSKVNVRDAIEGVYEQIVDICGSVDGQTEGPELAVFLEKELRPLMPEGIEFDFAFYESGVQHIFFEKANPQNAIIL